MALTICSRCLVPVDEVEISWDNIMTNDNVCVYCVDDDDE
jgi:hypothetical protein